jgi:hypothetical protein
MADYHIHFTVAEARATLPELRKRLLRIQTLLAEIRREQERAGKTSTLVMRGNGKGPLLTGTGTQKEDAQRLIEEIAAQGIQIKDLERGLVDFPHFLQDNIQHEVFLCWHLGEDTIEFWHEIEAGYGGRQPL